MRRPPSRLKKGPLLAGDGKDEATGNKRDQTIVFTVTHSLSSFLRMTKRRPMSKKGQCRVSSNQGPCDLTRLALCWRVTASRNQQKTEDTKHNPSKSTPNSKIIYSASEKSLENSLPQGSSTHHRNQRSKVGFSSLSFLLKIIESSVHLPSAIFLKQVFPR